MIGALLSTVERSRTVLLLFRDAASKSVRLDCPASMIRVLLRRRWLSLVRPPSLEHKLSGLCTKY